MLISEILHENLGIRSQKAFSNETYLRLSFKAKLINAPKSFKPYPTDKK